MLPLRDLQSKMGASILSGDFGPIEAFVLPDRLTAARRLAIHRNHHRTSLAAALAANFPVVERLVGPEFFAAAARHYLAADPPDSPCLSAWGGGFADFLAEFEPARSLPYLPDMARLEWARIEVSHAPDGRALDLRALSELAPEAQIALKLALSPAIRLLRSPHPIDRIWHANQTEDVRPVDLDEGECRLIVSGDRGGCRIERIEIGCLAFMEAAARGATFGATIEAAMAEDPKFNLAATLAIHRAHAALADTIATGPTAREGT